MLLDESKQFQRKKELEKDKQDDQEKQLLSGSTLATNSMCSSGDVLIKTETRKRSNYQVDQP